MKAHIKVILVRSVKSILKDSPYLRKLSSQSVSKLLQNNRIVLGAKYTF